MASRAITALFDDYEEAAKAVDRIEAAGVPHGDISIVASNESERHRGRLPPATASSHRDGDAAEGAGAGATVGTVLGGGAGLLAGLGMLAIPGVGPVVAAGWLVAAVTGAGVGAAAGGLLGALTGAGLSQSDAETYAEGVRRGGTLVTVRADDERADRVTSLLQKSGSIDLDQRAAGWRAQGWTGGTAGVDHTVARAATGHALADDDTLPADVPAPAADPERAPPTRLPPGGIR
ncbi:hypothetical protein HCU64_20300 [Methylobacterium sp. C25]|uniref:general stress protein n=1 Tax=Methylobacterium sp. C25 TaxID=2721622 RepID=UPI001F2C13A8|nr:general stress protein [Methylobacterium sp. C25]MCE4226097.1 hypothetical protein [Methylobacterium sp. C25]